MKIPIQVNQVYFWEILHACLICFLEGFLGGCLVLFGVGELTDKSINLLSDWNTWQAFKIFFLAGTVSGLIAIRNRLRKSPVDFAKLILLKVEKPEIQIQERPFKEESKSDSNPPAES